jgi:hypothetical protein
MRLPVLMSSAAVAVALLAGTASFVAPRPHDHDLTALRTATDTFHSIAVAEQNGYALLTDAAGIACIEMQRRGGMGVHWANSTLVDDPALVPDQPEAMVYAPGRDGTLQLAAVEYVVLRQAWDASHGAPPSLFGQSFDFTDTPNRYGLPPFYSLHVWAWKDNPAGTFSMWNPRVTCPATARRATGPDGPGEHGV